jgi:hypothetical protein
LNIIVPAFSTKKKLVNDSMQPGPMCQHFLTLSNFVFTSSFALDPFHLAGPVPALLASAPESGPSTRFVLHLGSALASANQRGGWDPSYNPHHEDLATLAIAWVPAHQSSVLHPLAVFVLSTLVPLAHVVHPCHYRAYFSLGKRQWNGSRLLPVPGVGEVRTLVPFVATPNHAVVVLKSVAWSPVIAIQSSFVATACQMCPLQLTRPLSNLIKLLWLRQFVHVWMIVFMFWTADVGRMENKRKLKMVD